MELPSFRYHPDPLRSGSVVASDAVCRCCRTARGFIYTGPVYAEEDLAEQLCPWCIASGAAHERFDATFVDSEAFTEEVSEEPMAEITERTPGYAAWQSEVWPVCCGEPCAFLEPVGIADIRAHRNELEGALMSHIVHDMGISGGAAIRLLDALQRDSSPTAYLFECSRCGSFRFQVDSL